MKLLIVSHEYPPIGGGGANACYFLTREFAQNGNEVTLITAQFENLSNVELTDAGMTIYRVKCKRKNKEKSSFAEMFSYLVSAWKKADKLLKTERYDKCLVFFGVPSGPLALHLKHKYKLPYIVRFGGGDIPGAQKRFKYVYKLLSPIIRQVWKEADCLIANSEGLRDRALKFEDKYNITVIENGVDSQFFIPKEKPENDTVRILFVSRLIEGKGLQYLIPNLHVIKEKVYQNCGKNIELVIVGGGPYRKELEALTDKENVRDIVRFEGRKNKNEVREYYQSADIFVLPSLSEGMPNVVLEAMSCGLPIVMTPCEGSKELVTDNGIITSIEELSNNLIKICSDRNMQISMGKNSLRNIEQNFQWKSKADKYMKLICGKEEIL
jgi:glycosyltransferase involved in cell wall biosynthesis